MNRGRARPSSSFPGDQAGLSRSGITEADETAGTAEALGHASPAVIYIAGFGRSGSTLLERTLGEVPGLVNVGELIDLFRRTATRGERCGCGLSFASCPFWASVGKRAYGGWNHERIKELQRLQRRVARQRHLPRLLTMRHAGHSFQGDVASYGANYARLYRAIAEEAGAAYIIDASKWPVQALALSRAGIDIRMIHLVRDVRGVAYSHSKAQVPRPHAVADADLMAHYAPTTAALRWSACQTQVELLRRCGLSVTRVRYDDFVRRPRDTVQAALAGLSLPVTQSQLAHIGDERIVLGHSHGLSGNPSRFREGEITLHADEEWRDRMSHRDRTLVTAIGLPLLLRYGWARRGQPATDVRDPAATAAPPAREQWPLVSVIMPTRGRPELVRESIAAVITQTYPGDIECLVIHDQEPPDEDLTALGTEQRRVRAVSNAHAPGLAGARNTGLDLATGDYIATCDDDDVWHPAKLQLQIARMLEEPALLVIGSGVRLRLPGKLLDWPGRSELISYQLLLRNRVKELHSSTLVMRRDAFAKAGRYDEALPYGYAEDYDWVLRAARAGRIGMVAQPLADIRKDAGSWYQGSAEHTASALEYMLAKHPDIARSRRGHARVLGQIAFARSSLGERGPATRYAMVALRRWPASPYPYVALAHVATGVHPRHLLRAARLFRRGLA